MTELRIELVYDRNCPNVAAARVNIRTALAEVGAEIQWSEWERGDAATPEAFQRHGSPTVLVNGHDVDALDAKEMPMDGCSCRIYSDDGQGLCGAPSASVIARALREQRRELAT
jgi:mercuric ion transport protein